MQILDKAYSLLQAGEPFALVSVVRAERPTSAKPGAKAIITADGTLTGWVGGSCAEPTVKRAAQLALRDGQPRLLRLCPPEKRGLLPQEGVTEVTMTCISGGTLEMYIEPQLSQPHLLVIGHLATAQALARLAKGLDYRVSVVGLDVTSDRFPQADHVVDRLDLSGLEITPNTYIVIASHGNYDEDALEAALRTQAAYVALIASKSRAQAIIQYLGDSSLSAEQIARLKYPAGLDLGAITPEEIGLSILAEIVQLRRQNLPVQPEEEERAASSGESPTAVDPVCGMLVDIATARYTSEYLGQTYYFCARGCQHSFEANPADYLTKEDNSAI
ncbi:MAG: XdhC family protein [Anaerolineales bacterium]|jgi:xanthine dehydrogenase accessory factor